VEINDLYREFGSSQLQRTCRVEEYIGNEIVVLYYPGLFFCFFVRISTKSHQTGQHKR